MITGRILRARRRFNNANREIPFWTWGSPLSPAVGQFILEPNEHVVLFEPPLVGQTPEGFPETSWLVLTGRGYTYVFLFNDRTIEEAFDGIS